jgi:hypothetical protein
MPLCRAHASAAILLLGAASAVSAQGVGGSLGGRLTDESGGALPGVTVSIACAGSGAVIATVTGGTGEYAVPGLPAGPCSVTFELAGFEKAVRERIDVQERQVTTVNQQLGLAKLEETVTVVAKAPPVRTFATPKPRPRIQPGPVPPHDIDSVCGPGIPEVAQAGHVTPSAAARLVGDRDEGERLMFAPGDAIVIDAGWADGLAVGQTFVVRRQYRPSDLLWDASIVPAGVHSAGLVQVFEVSETSAIVAVVYACDAFMSGDELAAFVPEPLSLPGPEGPPDFGRPAHILFGDEGRMLGAPQRLMVIDQGADDGLEVGQRMTLFRRTRFARGGVSRIGEAVVVAVREDWSRIRIESVHDVVFAGDEAAPHRPPKASRKTTGTPNTR